MTREDLLTHQLQREQRRSALLEQLIEDKTRELFLSNEALRAYAQELEARVEARTTELKEALSRAEDASSVKSSFLAQMSHELRTPLHGIIGMVDLLARTPLQPAQRNYVEIVQRSSQHLLAVIGDILDFTRLEAGKLTLESIPLSPVELLLDVHALYQGAASQKGLLLELNLPNTDVPSVIGDPVRVRQILSNLVNNAIKFTASGAITIHLALGDESTTDSATQQIELVWAVSDTGVGIPPAAVANLFQAFTQADTSTSRQFGGSGLGLSICRQLAERMGGSITVESSLGYGSVFTFTTRHAVCAHPLASAPERTLDAPPLPRGVRVLFVDDHPVNQQIGEALLEELGCRVRLASNGREALELVGREPFDIVLMDCHMPDMDGYAATRALRALGYELPIIALTADASAENRQMVLQAGMQDLVGKPFRQQALEQLLRQYVCRAAAPPPPPGEPPANALPTPPLFDADAALEAVGGKEKLLARIVSTFLGAAEGNLQKIVDAVEEQDPEAVRRAAHALKGAAASLHAVRLRQVAAEMEEEGKRGTVDAQRLPRLVETSLQTMRALQHWQEQRAA